MTKIIEFKKKRPNLQNNKNKGLKLKLNQILIKIFLFLDF
jgi:hypothetical protein